MNKPYVGSFILIVAIAGFLGGCGGGAGGTPDSGSAATPAPALPAPSPAPTPSPSPSSAIYTLTITTAGSGTVTSSAAGIDCGANCTANYTSGTSVTLTAAPAAGYTFGGWSGACAGGNAACTVVMNAAKTATAAFVAANVSAGGPHIFYTDIVSGPNTGGEGNNGAYLTLVGNGFGAARGASTVTINGAAVAAYKQWSDTKITVQPGAGASSGPIRITVGGTTYSHPSITFTVVPGKIFFVALNGNDTGGVIGDIGHPFRTIQTVLDRADFGPGDHAVVRGGNWSDIFTQYDSFFSIHHKSGTAAAPLVVMGYPTETVNLVRTTQRRGIHSFATDGHFVIANFHLQLNQSPGSIGIAPGTVDVRVVNNEVQGMYEDSGGAAAIDGSGKQYRIFGNHVHDNGGSKLYHALYFDGRDLSGPDDIEIAYNHIHHQTGGRGVQIYGDTGTLIKNVRVHHNLIHDIALDGILFSRDTATGLAAYDNVVYRTAVAELRGPSSDIGTSGGCIRFADPHTVAEVYNNTFVDCATDGDADSGAFRFDDASSVTLRNNIVVGKYTNGSTPPAGSISSNNLWFSAGAPPAWDTSARNGDPLFVNAAARDYHLGAGSDAIDRGSPNVSGVVTTDFDATPRPLGAGYDIGAYEFTP